MTEKRFTLTNRSLSEIGNDIAIADDGVPCTQRFVCHLLNELTEENEQLRMSDTICDYETTIARLEDENEQLKKQLKSKERVIGAYEQFINDLKEDGVLDD